MQKTKIQDTQLEKHWKQQVRIILPLTYDQNKLFKIEVNETSSVDPRHKAREALEAESASRCATYLKNLDHNQSQLFKTECNDPSSIKCKFNAKSSMDVDNPYLIGIDLNKKLGQSMHPRNWPSYCFKAYRDKKGVRKCHAQSTSAVHIPHILENFSSWASHFLSNT